MTTLSAAQVKGLQRPGRYGDGGGLYLVIRPNGAKGWVQRITVDGRRHDKGLGNAERVTLSAARRAADANRVAVASGRNPWAALPLDVASELEDGERTMPTFAEAAVEAHGARAHRWKNPKHRQSWLQTLERHAFPLLGEKPVDVITTRDVLAVLRPIWTTRPETARRVRQRIRSTFATAKANGHIVGDNPAGDAIDGALFPTPRLSRGPMPALPFEDVPAAFTAIHESQWWHPPTFSDDGAPSYWSPPWASTRLAFEFLILTACRSGEARDARWADVDLEARLWTIPGERMKAGRAHRVPLSEQAVDVLREAWREIGDNREGLVFATPAGRKLSDNALAMRAKKEALGCVPHGFRSSFKGWSMERTQASWAAIELALAHAIGTSVEESYRRTDLLDARRPLLQAWADYVTPRIEPPF